MPPDLIIFRGEFVEAFLDNMVTVRVLGTRCGVGAVRGGGRVDLGVVSKISLNPLPVSVEG